MRTKLALSLILVVIGPVVWWTVHRSSSTADATLPPPASGVSLTRITLEAPGGLVALEKSNGDWTLTNPVRARVEPSAAQPLVAAIESLASGKVAASDRSHPGPYGFDTSAIVVHSTWVTPSGTTTERVSTVGAGVPGGTYYATDNDPRVFLGREGLRELFSKPYAELRDRSVLAFDPSTVRRLFVQMGEKRWLVERTPNGWKRTNPSEATSDNVSVEELLSLLAQTKARDYVDDRRPSDTSALAALGFSSPSALMTLVTPSGSRTLLVAESDANGGHRVYAREAAGGPVMVVDGAVLETLRTTMTRATEVSAPVETPAP